MTGISMDICSHSKEGTQSAEEALSLLFQEIRDESEPSVSAIDNGGPLELEGKDAIDLPLKQVV